jgi:hypothetical protein
MFCTLDNISPCQLFGHRYTFEGDDEVFDTCIDCNEPRYKENENESLPVESERSNSEN